MCNRVGHQFEDCYSYKRWQKIQAVSEKYKNPNVNSPSPAIPKTIENSSAATTTLNGMVTSVIQSTLMFQRRIKRRIEKELLTEIAHSGLTADLKTEMHEAFNESNKMLNKKLSTIGKKIKAYQNAVPSSYSDEVNAMALMQTEIYKEDDFGGANYKLNQEQDGTAALFDIPCKVNDIETYNLLDSCCQYLSISEDLVETFGIPFTKGPKCPLAKRAGKCPTMSILILLEKVPVSLVMCWVKDTLGAFCV